MGVCMKRLILALLLAAMTAASLSAHTADQGIAGPGVGIDEKLGAYVPLDTAFVAEDGSRVTLREVIKGPTVLSIFYYKCQNACDYLLTDLSAVLKQLGEGKAGEPNLVSVSLDETETPADARASKKLALEMIERPFPAAKWRFLTSPDPEAIDRLCDSVGYRFRRNGDAIEHPLGLIILAPDGKVIRYINGTDFLPVDLSISLMEASTGTVQPTIARVIRFCFKVDPKSHQLVFDMLRVSAIVIFVLVGGFVAYLIVSGRKRRAKGGS
jgi:protein SCO1